MEVISFSHFLPRQDLIFGSVKRQKKSPSFSRDPHPKFNFSRVAGTAALAIDIERLIFLWELCDGFNFAATASGS